jgi:response regulator RpfG family c-di-GMP phosphodiesterase
LDHELDQDKKLIFVCGDRSQRAEYFLYLENIFSDHEIVEAFTSKAAIEELKKSHKVSFVLSTDNLVQGTAGLIYSFIKNFRKDTPFFYMSKDGHEDIEDLIGFLSHNPKNNYIPLPVSPTSFRQTIFDSLFPTRFNKQTVPAFREIRGLFLARYNKALCSVYIQKNKSCYEKIIRKNQEYKYQNIKTTLEENDFKIFIKNEDYEKFNVSNTSPNFLEQKDYQYSSKEINLKIESTHHLLDTFLNPFGFKKDQVEKARNVLRKARKIISKDNKFEKLIKPHEEKIGYIYDHSYLLTVITNFISTCANEEDNHANECLTMASLLHDITLNEQLSEIQLLNDLNLKKYSVDEQVKFLNHPIDIASQIIDSKYIPNEVAEIVSQHHENCEGTGFPEKIHPTKLAAQSCIFIIAQDYLNELYRIDFDPCHHQEVLLNLEEKYQSGHFLKPMRILMSLSNHFKQAKAA